MHFCATPGGRQVLFHLPVLYTRHAANVPASFWDSNDLNGKALNLKPTQPTVVIGYSKSTSYSIPSKPVDVPCPQCMSVVEADRSRNTRGVNRLGPSPHTSLGGGCRYTQGISLDDGRTLNCKLKHP